MAQSTKHIRLAYDPRRAFTPFHNRKQRWACLVAHRRAGKTVAAVNDMIRAAVRNRETPYAYFAPYRAQAKAVAWDYFKSYSLPIKGKEPNEADLKISLINGSSIQLFGADNADAARGLGFGGVYCDEYGDFRPSVWGNVIRPTLSDRKGWAVFGGTPKGHNQFYDVYRLASSSPEWFCLTLKASQSGILDKEELDAARSQLSEDQYNQEYECSFDAAILGAYYGKEMALVDAEGRLRSVDYDPAFPVNTAWDIGRTDDTSIWWYQNIAGEIRVLDHHSESGGSIEEERETGTYPGSITKEVIDRAKEKGYHYGKHYLPHDARAKTLAANGKNVIERLSKYLGISSLAIVPDIGLDDGIQAARSIFGRCYFDHKCNKDSKDGIEALRQYQKRWDEDKKVFAKDHLHNWASNPADAFRMLAVAERRQIAETNNKPKFQGPGVPIMPMIPTVLPKSIYTMSLDELWKERDERLLEVQKI